jgi:hypothetical protein
MSTLLPARPHRLSGLSGPRLHNARSAFRNSNNPDNDNTNIGLLPCSPSPPAPFTVRTVARDCGGRTRRVQTRSGDHRRSRLIRTSPAHCPTAPDLGCLVGFSALLAALRRFARACRVHPWVLQADIRSSMIYSNKSKP